MGGEIRVAQEQFQISQAQSRKFARAIYADISAYVKAHQEKYLKFLSQEETKNDRTDQGTHRSKGL